MENIIYPLYGKDNNNIICPICNTPYYENCSHFVFWENDYRERSEFIINGCNYFCVFYIYKYNIFLYVKDLSIQIDIYNNNNMQKDINEAYKIVTDYLKIEIFQ